MDDKVIVHVITLVPTVMNSSTVQRNEEKVIQAKKVCKGLLSKEKGGKAGRMIMFPLGMHIKYITQGIELPALRMTARTVMHQGA